MINKTLYVGGVCLYLFLCVFPVEGRAKDYYFDSSMVGDGVDISVFNNGSQLPGIYPVDVFLNGEKVDSKDIKFYSEEGEGTVISLKACVTEPMLAQYGVKLDEYPGLFHSDKQRKSANSECADISGIPDATLNFQFTNRQLFLSIPQIALYPSYSGIAPEFLWDDGIDVGLLNWQMSTSKTLTEGHLDKNETNDYWASLESGINLGAWRLRNLTTWNSSYHLRSHWTRVYSKVERGITKLKSRLILGEDYTPSDIFNSFPIRGVILSSDENMIPYEQRAFAPMINGIARTQARVEVRQGGYLLQSTTVAPGAFELANLPISGGAGDLDVTVVESDGSTQRFTVPYTAPALSLRKGYLQYNFSIGQYRPSDNSIEKASIGQITAIYGLPWDMTAFGGVQIAKHYRSGALGFGVSLGKGGAISVDQIQSQGELKKGDIVKGESWRVRYSKSFIPTATSFAISTEYYPTLGYHSLSDVLDTYNNTAYYDSKMYLHNRTNLNITQSLGNLGYLGMFGRVDKYRSNVRNQSIGASFSSTWKDILWSLNWSRNARYRHGYGISKEKGDNISFWMSIPLNLKGTEDNNIRATIQAQNTGNNRARYDVGLNGWGDGHRLFWSVGEQLYRGSNNGETKRVSLDWKHTYGELNGMYSYSSVSRQLSLGASGGLLIHSHGITAGQKMGNTVALIEAPGVVGASVGNDPGIRTDFRGYALLSSVAPYQENVISLDPTTFPSNAEVLQTDMRVVPTTAAVVRAHFNTRVGERVLFTIKRTTGEYVPFGALASARGKNGRDNNSGIFGYDGEVYMSGLEPIGELKVSWGKDKSCHMPYRLPERKNSAGIYVVNGVCI